MSDSVEIVAEEKVDKILDTVKKEKELADTLIEKAWGELKIMEEQIRRMEIMSDVYLREIQRIKTGSSES